jgi:flagellar motor switch/type III secretory pathway protein FliN
MPELTPEIVAKVADACRAGVEDVAAAFSRITEVETTLSVGDPSSFDTRGLAEGGNVASLVVVLKVGGRGALVVLPESSGLVPDWCADPDPTERSKLATLARELGAIVLPEDYQAEGSAAGRVDDLAAALIRGGLAGPACMVPLELRTADGREAQVRLIWPLDHPDAVLGPDREASMADADEEAAPEALIRSEPSEPGALPQESIASSRSLPDYARSLLKIKVPVVVTLARKRQPLERILDLGPGSIIHFDKSCERMLDLDVGRHPVATGEAVKVGDKFGLRINSMILPDERFKPVTGGQSDASPS